MVPEGVGDASDAPMIGLVGDRPDDRGSGGNGAVEDSVGIVDCENDADGASVEAFGAEIEVLGRLVSEPEIGSSNGEVRDDRAAFGRRAKNDHGSERGFVEVDSLGSVPDVEQRGQGGFNRIRH